MVEAVEKRPSVTSVENNFLQEPAGESRSLDDYVLPVSSGGLSSGFPHSFLLARF